jgi:hypothetical protein
MKKALVIFAGLIFLVSCSNKKQLTGDLAGRWIIYKITQNNIDQSALVADSFQNYTISFTSAGQYIEQNAFGTDTSFQTGTWQFQNNNEQLVLTDTTLKPRTYTIFDLMGNSVQLLRNGQDRYMRKVQ